MSFVLIFPYFFTHFILSNASVHPLHKHCKIRLDWLVGVIVVIFSEVPFEFRFLSDILHWLMLSQFFLIIFVPANDLS